MFENRRKDSRKGAKIAKMDENRRKDSRKGAKIAKMDENSLGKETVDAAIGVHRELGPGLLESVYLNGRLLGDLGGLARENPDSNQFMHQTAYAAFSGKCVKPRPCFLIPQLAAN
ncbi:hypothetical protein AKJ60_00175 [candidate division MSBL1 archaeon SCGC-AAA385M11]|nr:hypothetical protein AKJ60_00175 [candidate division MSBL1 archaeon SCGC-AAA385M11]